MNNVEIIDSEFNDISTLDGKVITVELKKTKYAESRLLDIQTTNGNNLQELITVFLCACHELNRAISIINNHLALNKHQQDIIRSTVLIQKMPFLIDQCKQRSSEDVRNALIELDPEYQNNKKTTIMLETCFNNLKDKRKVIEMAYFSCQKIAEFKNIYKSTASYNYGQYDNVQAGSELS